MNYFLDLYVFNKLFVVNANGNKDLSLTTLMLFFLSIIMKSILPTNSSNTCLQAPQGGVNFELSETMAIAVNSVIPSEIALNAAVRSAQIVSPKELFSMLQPV